MDDEHTDSRPEDAPAKLPNESGPARDCPSCERRRIPSQRTLERRDGKHTRPGRPGHDAITAWYSDLLRYLHDPLELQLSHLLKLPIVEHLGADYEAQGIVLPHARALQKAGRRALSDIARDFDGSALGGLATAILDERSQAAFARERGVGEEWVSRTLKPRLITLVRLQVEAIQKRYLARVDGAAAPPPDASNDSADAGEETMNVQD